MNTRFSRLPRDIKCQTLSYVTDWDQIKRLSEDPSMIPLLQKCIRSIDTDEPIPYEDNELLLLSLQNVETLPAIWIVNKETDISELAALPKLHSIHLDVTGVKDAARSAFDFLKRYATGLYWTETLIPKYHDRDFRGLNFSVVEDETTDLVSIHDGVLCCETNPEDNNTQLIIRLVHERRSLIGFQFSHRVYINIDYLLSVEEFIRVDIASADSYEYDQSLIDGIRRLLQADKLEIIGNPENTFRPAITVHNAAILLTEDIVSPRLRIVEIPVSIENLEKVIKKYPSLEAVGYYIDDATEIPEMTRLLQNYPKMTIIVYGEKDILMMLPFHNRIRVRSDY